MSAAYVELRTYGKVSIVNRNIPDLGTIMKITDTRSGASLVTMAKFYALLSVVMFVGGVIGGAALAINGIDPAAFFSRQ